MRNEALKAPEVALCILKLTSGIPWEHLAHLVTFQ